MCFRIAAAAPLHDVGKIAIPDAILTKPGALDAKEWTVMRRHAGVGGSLMQGSRSQLLDCAAEIALTHHERFDGSGYPHKLRGDAIPVPARMMSISDIYDALTASDRPYKKAMPVERALDIVASEVKRGQLDDALFQVFLGAQVWRITLPKS